MSKNTFEDYETEKKIVISHFEDMQRFLNSQPIERFVHHLHAVQALRSKFQFIRPYIKPQFLLADCVWALKVIIKQKIQSYFYKIKNIFRKGN